MRQLAILATLSLLPVIPLFAQRGGGGRGGGGRGGGMGGGGMRGGGGMHSGGGGMHAGGSFRGGGFRGGGFRGGFGRGFRGNFGFNPFFGFYSPFYPGIYGAGFFNYCDPFIDIGCDYGYAQPSYPSSYSYPAYPAGSSGGVPAVIINQNTAYPPGPPPEQAYAPPPQPAIRYPPTQATQQYQAPLYLIAFHDGVIRAVLAYWVDGSTLHYVNMDHQEMQTPLSTVDGPLSERLNSERNVTFALPR